MELLHDLLRQLLSENTPEGLLWHVIEHVGHRGGGPRPRDVVSALDSLICSRKCPITRGDAIWAWSEVVGLERPVDCKLRGDLLGVLRRDEQDAERSGVGALDEQHALGHAIRTVGRLGTQLEPETDCFVKELETLLKHPNAEFRWIVPEAAVDIGTRPALRLLEVAVREGACWSDPRVVGSALWELVRLRNRPPPEMIARIATECETRLGRGGEVLDQRVRHLGRTLRTLLRLAHHRLSSWLDSQRDRTDSHDSRWASARMPQRHITLQIGSDQGATRRMGAPLRSETEHAPITSPSLNCRPRLGQPVAGRRFPPALGTLPDPREIHAPQDGLASGNLHPMGLTPLLPQRLGLWGADGCQRPFAEYRSVHPAPLPVSPEAVAASEASLEKLLPGLTSQGTIWDAKLEWLLSEF